MERVENLDGWSVIKNSANANVVDARDELRAFSRKNGEIGAGRPLIG
jgi:hypothetical protein